MIVGVDAGNYEVKVVNPRGYDRFPSDLGEYRERNLEQHFSEDDMIVEYEGKRYFAGTLAKYESEFGGRMMGDSKAHQDCKLRVLIALHRMGFDTYRLVVGQPISRHTKVEKEKIKQMLIGYHSLSINGKKTGFLVQKAEVAAEGGSAFWSQVQNGLVRIIDVGSSTVNCATLNYKRYVDKDSFSLMIGMNTTKTQDCWALARHIVTEAGRKWGKEDVVKIVGGAASALLPHIHEYFPRADVIQPLVAGKYLPPVFGNAAGFFRIGVSLYDYQVRCL